MLFRSRVAVNIYPDPILERLAIVGLKDDQYGRNDRGELVVNLCEFENGWVDLNNGYPRFDNRLPDPGCREDVEHMNRYVTNSVNWMLKLHAKAMRKAHEK